MKNSNRGIILFSSLSVLSLPSCTEQPSQSDRPNIILILADDLGFSDMGCYGGEIHTPNLNWLSENGIRYNQFYNASRSCPSRASLLTGLTPHQAGVGHMVADLGYDGYRGELLPNTVTIAEALKGVGYNTAMAGKWHVTKNVDPAGDIHNFPLQRGFDKYYGTLTGHGSLYDPKCLFDGNTPIEAEGDYYYTEAITDHVKRYIDEFDESENPFFLYVAYTAPHYPLHARQEYIDKYKDIYSKGWDVLQEERVVRLKEMGLIPKDLKATPRDDQSYLWDEDTNKEWQASRMQAYAAMVEQMDLGIGEIIAKLEAKGQLDNTLIVFLSDNGASCEGHLDNTIERSGAPWKSGMIPEFTSSGKKVIPGDIPGVPLGADDTYGSYGSQWAHLSTTPFKRYKTWMHEGGINTPMIAFWRGQIVDGGAIRNSVHSIVDFMPTFLDVAQGSYPTQIRGEQTEPLTGESLVSSFLNQEIENTRVLCWEHEGNRAIRSGEWKLVSEYPGSWSTMRKYPLKGEWELYNMELDMTELNNVASEYPEVVAELDALWQKWADASKVEDWSTLGEKGI